MPRYIIHLGPYKTGSTYLQTRLYQHRDALAAAGFALASLWNSSATKPSHTGFMHRLVSERLHELKAAMAGWESSGAHTVIITSEEISTLCVRPIQLAMCAELLAGHDVTLIYYVRRWTDLLASTWQEYVKQGRAFQLPEVIVHNIRNPERSLIVNLDATVGKFAERFGKDCIRLVSYDALQESGADMFVHFARQFCGLEFPAEPQTRLNASLRPSETEMMRVFNIFQQETGVDSARLLRFFGMAHRPLPMTELLSHMDRYVTEIELADDDAAVRQLLGQNWNTYGSCLVEPALRGFYLPKTRMFPFIGPDYALTPGVAEALRQLWHDLLQIEAPRSA